MKYEKSRGEFYESEIHSMAEQIAQILDSGYSVEIGKSRSGLKLFAVSRKHEVVKRKGNLNE
jgi:hypothetical protein